MSSSRLPGKVLAAVHGVPALERLLTRLRASKLVDDIVLATTTSSADDVLFEWSLTTGVMCHRGSEDDVLARVVDAQRMMRSDVTVEVCGDCVLIDPCIVDRTIERFLQNDCDVATTTRISSYPLGQAVQVFRTDDLEDVATRIHDPAVREHVSLYFYEHPERYRVTYLSAPEGWNAPDVRTHIDYEEDLQFVSELCRRLEPKHGPLFGVPEMLRLLHESPELRMINSSCAERSAR
jgi:spore coat polysaccharide biosynthesis protein SpsF